LAGPGGFFLSPSPKELSLRMFSLIFSGSIRENTIHSFSVAVGSVALPSGDFRSDRGSEQRDQLNAIRETLEQLEGGTPNVIDA